MRSCRNCLAVAVLLASCLFTTVAMGAGFALYEGSARGNALGGTMVGRADDPSAIYFNPAGITQLEGLQFMAGATVIRPSATVDTVSPVGARESTTTEENDWIPPHFYGTYQVSDRVWSGLGLYSRFGLGTEFDESWPGRYNNYNAVIQTLTFNPDLAFRVNDKFSVAAGVSAMWFDLDLQRKVPGPGGRELDFEMTGDSIGYGYNVAARYQVVEKVALGAMYQSAVEQEVDGDAEVSGIGSSGATGDIELPSMVFLGIVFTPVDKLSIELGGVYTDWNSYDELKISFDDPTVTGVSESTTPKNWNSVWRYQAGIEYAWSETWEVRLGYVYDETPIPDETVDYLVPANDRQLYSVGCGYHWRDWLLEVSYTYLMIEDRTIAARYAEGVLQSEARDGDAHMVGLSVSTRL